MEGQGGASSSSGGDGKVVLLDRTREVGHSAPASPFANPIVAIVDPASSNPIEQLNALSCNELREELRARGLKPKGKKDDMTRALYEHAVKCTFHLTF
jgi:hypothetical protein